MCCDCDKLKGLVYKLEEQYQQMQEDLAPLIDGHPIVMIQNEDDIDAFDLTSGRGSGSWQNYAVCDGQTHGTGSNAVTTPDLRDKFVVGAGNLYNVDDTGGANTVALSIPELPSHSHVLTDPGHTHTVTDPGHTHAVTDPGHTHAASQVSHAHTFTTDPAGSHTHTVSPVSNFVNTNNNGLYLDGTVGASEVDDSQTITLSTEPDHTHTGTTSSATPAITNSNAFTGITVANDTTGITNDNNTTGVTIANTGSGTAHENRPPYYAVMFVMKVA